MVFWLGKGLSWSLQTAHITCTIICKETDSIIHNPSTEHCTLPPSPPSPRQPMAAAEMVGTMLRTSVLRTVTAVTSTPNHHMLTNFPGAEEEWSGAEQ